MTADYVIVSPATALVILGLVFMTLEAFIPSFGAAGLVGLTALVMGVASIYAPASMPAVVLGWDFVGMVAVFGAIMVGIVVFLALRVYRKNPVSGVEGMIGQTARVVEWHGRAGRVRIHGETWQAEAETVLDLHKGAPVTVTAVENLVLKIRAAD